jgi:hypothetical protein
MEIRTSINTVKIRCMAMVTGMSTGMAGMRNRSGWCGEI